MTYRTFEIDAGLVNGTATASGSDTPARNVRTRRHARVMGHHTSGSRVSGFGL